jgi:hypothetical protein
MRQVEELAEQFEAGSEPEVIAEMEALLQSEGDALEALHQKADAYCWVIDQIRARGAARREHAQRLTDLATADSQHADTMERALIQQLLKVSPDKTRFSLAGHDIKSRASTSVLVECDPKDLPAEYRREETKTSPNRQAIKDAIKGGASITGCSLVERRNWTIT